MCESHTNAWRAVLQRPAHVILVTYEGNQHQDQRTFSDLDNRASHWGCRCWFVVRFICASNRQSLCPPHRTLACILRSNAPSYGKRFPGDSWRVQMVFQQRLGVWDYILFRSTSKCDGGALMPFTEKKADEGDGKTFINTNATFSAEAA